MSDKQTFNKWISAEECLKELDVIQEELNAMLAKTIKEHNRFLIMSGIVYITAAVAAFIILFTLLIRL